MRSRAWPHASRALPSATSPMLSCSRCWPRSWWSLPRSWAPTRRHASSSSCGATASGSCSPSPCRWRSSSSLATWWRRRPSSIASSPASPRCRARRAWRSRWWRCSAWRARGSTGASASSSAPCSPRRSHGASPAWTIAPWPRARSWASGACGRRASRARRRCRWPRRARCPQAFARLSRTARSCRAASLASSTPSFSGRAS